VCAWYRKTEATERPVVGSVRGTPACGADAIPRALCLRGPGV